jgi:predicted solute-binding protein
MASKVRLGVSDATYLRPLLVGLENADSPFELSSDLPAVNSVHLNKRTNDLRCAFLSPIDYARYGGAYRIVPHVCVSSANPTGTITFTVKNGVRNILKVAVDVRVTSEIVLAKIILLERFRNLPEDRSEIEFVPMMPSLDTMLQKADAALIVNLSPTKTPLSSHYTLDLVEEWTDMTGLPYVHGFWVAREEDIDDVHVMALIDARRSGVPQIQAMINDPTFGSRATPQELETYFESFSYDFGQPEIDSLSEFISFAYFHGALSDVPEINFFDYSAAPKN